MGAHLVLSLKTRSIPPPKKNKIIKTLRDTEDVQTETIHAFLSLTPSCVSHASVSVSLSFSLTVAEKNLILFKQDQLVAGDPGSSDVEVG